MGKAAMCIKMLQILNTGRVYKVSELATLLDTNPRNIIEYKRELDECEYFVDSIPGKYGGYELNKTNLIPTLRLSKEEFNAFDSGVNYLLSRNDFLNKEDFTLAISKIYSSLAKKEFERELTVINRYPLSMSEEEIEYRFNIIKECIKLKKKMKFKYVSLKNRENEYIFHPYDLFMYNNAWFMIGWCEGFGQILYFKINRITDLSITEKSFSVYKYYNKSDYIDSFGFRNNGEWYHVEFIASNNYASLVKERIYGKNQEIVEIDDKNTLVKVDMQNKENIIVFILGFGKNIKILEPDWLINEIKEICFEIIHKY